MVSRRNKQSRSNLPMRKSGSKTRLYVLLVVLALVAIALWQHQAIFDWIKLRNYIAPAAVAQLATEDTMSPYARKIFYVNAPRLQDKAAFKDCNVSKEQTIVLGCYKGNQNGIYLLTVS